MHRRILQHTTIMGNPQQLIWNPWFAEDFPLVLYPPGNSYRYGKLMWKRQEMITGFMTDIPDLPIKTHPKKTTDFGTFQRYDQDIVPGRKTPSWWFPELHGADGRSRWLKPSRKGVPMFICLIWNKQCQKKTANISKLIKEKHIIKQLQHQNNKRHKSVLANMGMVSMPPFSGGWRAINPNGIPTVSQRSSQHLTPPSLLWQIPWCPDVVQKTVWPVVYRDINGVETTLVKPQMASVDG